MFGSEISCTNSLNWYCPEELSWPQGRGYITELLLRGEHTIANLDGEVPISSIFCSRNLTQILKESRRRASTISFLIRPPLGQRDLSLNSEKNPIMDLRGIYSRGVS